MTINTTTSPISAGTPVKIADIGRSPTWSPDGTRIALWLPAFPPTLHMAKADGTDVVDVLDSSGVSLPSNPDGYPNNIAGSRWSADGQKLYFGLGYSGGSSVAFALHLTSGLKASRIVQLTAVDRAIYDPQDVDAR